MTVELTADQVKALDDDGFVRVDKVLTPEQVERYAELYEAFLSGAISTGHLRGDLGGHVDDEAEMDAPEHITQIMWPSACVPVLHDAPLHVQSLAMAQQYSGDDMTFDFDMLIDKLPHTDTSTPWHQDMAYWIKLPDIRSLSVWTALDEATVDNGCMWYVPGAHRKPMRRHWEAGKGGGALECEAKEEEGVPVPLPPGSAVLHVGAALHYSRGNTTESRRRAFIINCRPKTMVDLERSEGMDHGLTENVRKVRNEGEA
ncbi:MAG: phytanoyl-CoA dioxygenase [Phycisphaeraceae bacterium]|nr:phytanoyl-CoA dioxygenase [Phycisphaeraceae bacterium]